MAGGAGWDWGRHTRHLAHPCKACKAWHDAALGTQPAPRPTAGPQDIIPGMRQAEWSADGRTLVYTLPDDTGRDSKVGALLCRLVVCPCVGRCRLSKPNGISRGSHAFHRRRTRFPQIPVPLYDSDPPPIPCAHTDEQVMAHTVGRPLSEDTLLFEEPDPACFVSITRTKDWRYLLINSHSKLSSEVSVHVHVPAQVNDLYWAHQQQTTTHPLLWLAVEIPCWHCWLFCVPSMPMHLQS